MAYYEDMFGNMHYHEPAGSDPESWIGPGQTHVDRPDVTPQFRAEEIEIDPTILEGITVTPRKVHRAPTVHEFIELGGADLEEAAKLEKIGEVNPMTSYGMEGYEGGGGGLSNIPAAIAAVPGILGTIGGVAAAGVGLWQALGGGEGEGLFGLDILGGGNGGGGGGGGNYLNGIPLGGPGLKEPPAAWVEKEWHVSYTGFRLQYYLVRMPTGRKRIALYNTRTKVWKSWPWSTPRLAVIGKNMPSHKQIVRLRKNLGKHAADARTILKLTSPHSLREAKRRRR